MLSLRARVLTPVTPHETRYLEDAVVVVDAAGLIVELGPWDGREGAEDVRAGVLVPGFVDSHVHFPQSRIIGAASGPLLDWLENAVFPEEARFADPVHARRVAEEFSLALVSGGTTGALVYGSVHADATHILFEELAERGVRAIAGPVWMDSDCPEELRIDASEARDGVAQLVERWHGHDDDRLRVAVIPRFALACSPAMLKTAGEVAAQHGLTVSTHLAETLTECRLVRERFGVSDYLSVYEDAGLLVPGAVFAHCVHLDEKEWNRFQEGGGVVAHCPDSNFFLGSGSMPVNAARVRGIPLTVGTDVAAGRTFRIPQVLSSAYDNVRMGEDEVPLEELLWWGTRGGALALGWKQTGQIEVGMEADLALLEMPPWVTTHEEVLGHVLFHRDRGPALGTWVRGREVWRLPD
jgi:guanine deaminase